MLQNTEMKNELFEIISEQNEVKFRELLEKNDPSTKCEGVPLLHFVVRNAGPIHLQALIECGIDVNSLTEQNTQSQASALQWITGMICPEKFYFGWPRNYEAHSGHLSSVGIHGYRVLDGFVGSANEIMFEISNILLANGAKIDFYSACALGYQNNVKEYLMSNSELLLASGPDGGSALAWAARRGQNDIISLLIENGANVNQLNATSSLTPLEEAILFHGTEETVKLLIERGAWIRKGIIGICCKSRIDLADLLLSCVDAPSSLVINSDVKEIQTTVYYKKMLQVFAKYRISLSEIDKERILSDRPLVFDGCTGSHNILRLLISMGCNINASFPAKFVWVGENNENGDLIGAKPMVFLYLHLQQKTSKNEKLKILQKMALLFFHGSDINPIYSTQPHPLNDLHDTDLKNFLSFLYDEIKSNQDIEVYPLSKLNGSSRALLKKKIGEASITSSDEDIKNKLEYLVYCCEPPSLTKLCINSIVKNGLFKNTQKLNVPDELKETIEYFAKLKQ